MDNVKFIVRMRDYSLRLGADGTARGFIRKWQENMHKRQGVSVTVNGLNGKPRGNAVLAYIHQGQWIADCDECGGHEFVDPSDPVFFCWGCVNRANESYLRPVQFPEQWEQIEAAILERPVNDVRGASDLERAGLAQPAVIIRVAGVDLPLVRSWKPDESLEDLRAQNRVLDGLTLKPGGVVVVEVPDGI